MKRKPRSSKPAATPQKKSPAAKPVAPVPGAVLPPALHAQIEHGAARAGVDFTTFVERAVAREIEFERARGELTPAPKGKALTPEDRKLIAGLSLAEVARLAELQELRSLRLRTYLRGGKPAAEPAPVDREPPAKLPFTVPDFSKFGMDEGEEVDLELPEEILEAAEKRAAAMGMSFDDYVARLVSQDIGKPVVPAGPVQTGNHPPMSHEAAAGVPSDFGAALAGLSAGELAEVANELDKRAGMVRELLSKAGQPGGQVQVRLALLPEDVRGLRWFNATLLRGNSAGDLGTALMAVARLALANRAAVVNQVEALARYCEAEGVTDQTALLLARMGA